MAQVNKIQKIGAEAQITEVSFDGSQALLKKRSQKNYRNKILDQEIRAKRTKSESKLLREAAKVVNTPKVINVDEKEGKILMEKIEGVQLKEIIEKKQEFCEIAGEKIRALHETGIIHGDLTTSNILVAEENSAEMKERVKSKGKLFFIDFGLGYFSIKIEDKATDLIVFKKTFNATHSGIKEGWELVMKGYKPSKELIDRMNAIEKRARYH